MVEPRTSFAIQVKCSADKVEAHNTVGYLQHLEIPFFLGIVDQTAAELRIYSAEHFPMMTAVYGYPEKLWLRPVESCDPQRPYEGLSAQAGVTLDCYHVCTFTASESRDEIRPKVDQLLKLCRRAVNNIGTRRVEEHIYQLDDVGTQFPLSPDVARSIISATTCTNDWPKLSTTSSTCSGANLTNSISRNFRFMRSSTSR